jgi:hypothetical protein
LSRLNGSSVCNMHCGGFRPVEFRLPAGERGCPPRERQGPDSPVLPDLRAALPDGSPRSFPVQHCLRVPSWRKAGMPTARSSPPPAQPLRRCVNRIHPNPLHCMQIRLSRAVRINLHVVERLYSPPLNASPNCKYSGLLFLAWTLLFRHFERNPKCGQHITYKQRPCFVGMKSTDAPSL